MAPEGVQNLHFHELSVLEKRSDSFLNSFFSNHSFFKVFFPVEKRFGKTMEKRFGKTVRQMAQKRAQNGPQTAIQNESC